MVKLSLTLFQKRKCRDSHDIYSTIQIYGALKASSEHLLVPPNDMVYRAFTIAT